jgi:hypothetical protein
MSGKGDPKGKGEAFRQSLKKDFKQASFCPYTMTSEDKANCKKWEFPPEHALDVLLALASKGYKITLKLDTEQHAYACWLISPEDNVDNPNEILSGRGSSPEKALKQAAYMHYKLFDEVWPKRNVPTSPEDIDD